MFWTDPTTVSPVWKTPDIMLISKSFGTQYFVTLTPSKNAYNWVSGFIFLHKNWIFLDLINEMRFLLTTLSPTEVLSNCSLTIVLFPVLVCIPVSVIVLKVSWITEFVVISTQAAGLVSPPFGQPPLPTVLDEDSVLVLVPWETSWPVQFVSQAFHTVGENPVCGSTFKVLLAVARVSV